VIYTFCYKYFKGEEGYGMAIHMSIDEVVEKGNEISSHQEDVTALQNYLESVVNSQLPEIWQGSGYEGFAARVAEMAPSFEAMRQLMEDIGQGVISNARQYEEFDNAAGSSNRG
jgi:Putative lipoprotein